MNKDDYTKGSQHWMLTRLAFIKNQAWFILNHPDINADLLKTYAERTKQAAQELIDGVPMEIYLIEKIWIDPTAKEFSLAQGYATHTFRFTEWEAQSVCAKGKTYTSDDCWAVFGKMPEYRYKKIRCI